MNIEQFSQEYLIELEKKLSLYLCIYNDARHKNADDHWKWHMVSDYVDEIRMQIYRNRMKVHTVMLEKRL